jgi:hypothetical protein
VVALPVFPGDFQKAIEPLARVTAYVFPDPHLVALRMEEYAIPPLSNFHRQNSGNS